MVRLSIFTLDPNQSALLIGQSILITNGLVSHLFNNQNRSRYSNFLSFFGRGLILLVLGGLFYALCLTGSRGCVASTFVTVALFWSSNVRSINAEIKINRADLLYVVAGICLVCTALVSSGLASRVGLILEGDASVTGRIEIWSGAAWLISSSPLTGWGMLRSGELIRLFYESRLTLDYRTPASGLLELGASFGALVLWLVLILPIFVLRAQYIRNKNNMSEGLIWRIACAQILLFFFSNIFNTLLYQYEVLIIPILSTLFLVFNREASKAVSARMLSTASISSFIVVAGILGYGILTGPGLAIKKIDGGILIKSRSMISTEPIMFLYQPPFNAHKLKFLINKLEQHFSKPVFLVERQVGIKLIKERMEVPSLVVLENAESKFDTVGKKVWYLDPNMDINSLASGDLVILSPWYKGAIEEESRSKTWSIPAI